MIPVVKSRYIILLVKLYLRVVVIVVSVVVGVEVVARKYCIE